MDCKSRDSKKKLQYILECQAQGLEPQAIADNMKYSKLKNLNEFMSSKGYKNIGSRYILKEDTCPTNDIQTNTTVSLEAKEDNCLPSVRQAVEENEKLNNILNSSTEIFEMLEWFREMKAKYPTVDIPLNFNIDYNKSNVIKTTVRLDEDVWNTFSDICKNKYSHLSKVDILSQILKNFNDENK